MISVNITNRKGLDRVIEDLQRQQRDVNVNMTKKILFLTNLIKSNLRDAIGEKAKHFDVQVNPFGIGVQIIVAPNDDVGRFIYSGTSAHDISSSYEPMPMPDGGFSRSVRHPGTKSLKPQIDRAVSSAVAAARFI